MNTLLRFCHLIPLALAVSVLPACGPRTSHQSMGGELSIRPTVSGQVAYRQALVSAGAERQQALITAATQFMAAGQVMQAQQALRRCDRPSLSLSQRFSVDLLRAEIALRQGRIVRALRYLPNANEALTGVEQQQLYRAQTRTFAAAGNWRAQMLAQNHLIALTEGEQRNQALQDMWQLLTTMSPAVRRDLLQSMRYSQPEVQAWLRFVSIATEFPAGSAQWRQQLAAWQQQYPQHAANALLHKMQQQSYGQPATHMALLLPLSGPYAAQGAAIQRGIMAAYYAQQQRQPTAALRISVYDTHQLTAVGAYQAAIRAGADQVVGPLLKQNCRALLQAVKPTVPVLALNNIAARQANVYQYSLAPNGMVDAIAGRLAQQGHWQVLLLNSSRQKYQALSTRFARLWQQMGGVIVNDKTQVPVAHMAKEVADILHVSHAKQRWRRLQKTLRTKIRFTSARRHDVDAIVILGGRTFAQRVVPLLKYNFAGQLPIIGVPAVYNEQHQIGGYQDLNHLQLLALPWYFPAKTATVSAGIQYQLEQAWPSAVKRYGRFYAMGVDAYRLSRQLPMLSAWSRVSLYGLTGRLSLNHHREVVRQAVWGKIKHGRLQKAVM